MILFVLDAPFQRMMTGNDRERLAWKRLLWTAVVLLAPAHAAAFNFFPLAPGDAQKWGSKNLGTASTVTWSLVPDGTPHDPNFPDQFLTISGVGRHSELVPRRDGEVWCQPPTPIGWHLLRSGNPGRWEPGRLRYR